MIQSRFKVIEFTRTDDNTVVTPLEITYRTGLNLSCFFLINVFLKCDSVCYFETAYSVSGY